MPPTKRFVVLAPRVGMTLVAGPTVLAAPGVAFATTAVTAKSSVGSPAWCAHHPKAAKKVPACNSGGGGGPPAIRVQIDPNPTVETDLGLVVAVIQVAAS